MAERRVKVGTFRRDFDKKAAIRDRSDDGF
jgi:hypothetical protein